MEQNVTRRTPCPLTTCPRLLRSIVALDVLAFLQPTQSTSALLLDEDRLAESDGAFYQLEGNKSVCGLHKITGNKTR